jgi:hypothetical protein
VKMWSEAQVNPRNGGGATPLCSAVPKQAKRIAADYPPNIVRPPAFSSQSEERGINQEMK